jgi:hypothetical protein
VTARLAITVQGQGRVRLAASDGRQSDASSVRLDPIHRRMIALFQDWLSEGWSAPERRKITRRRELEVLGSLLYEELLPGSLGAFLEDVVASSRADRDNRLRLELSFVDGAEELARLPWEYLYRPDTEVSRGYFLAIEPALALSRYMPLNAAVGALAPEDPPLRVLATASKPTDEGPVREAPTLEAINALTERLDVDVHVLESPTVTRFLEAVEDRRPHILHLIAHGGFDPDEGEGEIALLDESGAAAWIPDHTFAEYFGQVGATPRVVVLHACEGGSVDFEASFAGLAPKLIRAGVQAVLAMQYPVTNAAANAFSTAFYGEIAKGRPVDAAVQAGRWRMTLDRPKSTDTGEFGVPVLYLRSTDAVVAEAH